MNNGWICPKCGAVMAPWVVQCINCEGRFDRFTYASYPHQVPEFSSFTIRDYVDHNLKRNKKG